MDGKSRVQPVGSDRNNLRRLHWDYGCLLQEVNTSSHIKAPTFRRELHFYLLLLGLRRLLSYGNRRLPSLRRLQLSKNGLNLRMLPCLPVTDLRGHQPLIMTLMRASNFRQKGVVGELVVSRVIALGCEDMEEGGGDILGSLLVRLADGKSGLKL